MLSTRHVNLKLLSLTLKFNLMISMAKIRQELEDDVLSSGLTSIYLRQCTGFSSVYSPWEKTPHANILFSVCSRTRETVY